MSVDQLISALRAKFPQGGTLPVVLDMGEELRPLFEIDAGNEYVILRADWYPR